MIMILGLIAGACTTFATLPQIMKSWRTKNARDVSLETYALLAVGTCLWLLYGIFLRDIPIIAANIIALVLSSTMIYLKIRYG